eukprot:m.16015 g.16015  ORF g.16015 m.16015 type:complete len:322 (-) comp10880_c0_seq1:751-1716(-)
MSFACVCNGSRPVAVGKTKIGQYRCNAAFNTATTSCFAMTTDGVSRHSPSCHRRQPAFSMDRKATDTATLRIAPRSDVHDAVVDSSARVGHTELSTNVNVAMCVGECSSIFNAIEHTKGDGCGAARTLAVVAWERKMPSATQCLNMVVCVQASHMASQTTDVSPPACHWRIAVVSYCRRYDRRRARARLRTPRYVAPRDASNAASATTVALACGVAAVGGVSTAAVTPADGVDSASFACRVSLTATAPSVRRAACAATLAVAGPAFPPLGALPPARVGPDATGGGDSMLVSEAGLPVRARVWSCGKQSSHAHSASSVITSA